MSFNTELDEIQNGLIKSIQALENQDNAFNSIKDDAVTMAKDATNAAILELVKREQETKDMLVKRQNLYIADLEQQLRTVKEFAQVITDMGKLES